LTVEELSFEEAAHCQGQIAGHSSKSICTIFCKSDFLRYHENSRASDIKTIFLGGSHENSHFVLPLSSRLTEPDKFVSHLGSPYSGMCINSDQPEKIKGAYELCFHLIREKFPNTSSLEIRLPPSVLCPSTPAHEWALWSLGYIPTVTYFGRYFSPATELNLNRNRRRRIDKIDVAGIEIKIGDVPSPAVYEILVENRRIRHSTTPIHTLEDLQRIEECLPDTLRTYWTQHSGKICSVAIIFQDLNFVTIQYLAGSECSFDCGSQDLLVLELIRKYSDSNKILLFGTSTEPGENHRVVNSGLDNFKESFGATAYISSRVVKSWN
jgi:hypothetical protein